MSRTIVLLDGGMGQELMRRSDLGLAHIAKLHDPFVSNGYTITGGPNG